MATALAFTPLSGIAAAAAAHKPAPTAKTENPADIENILAVVNGQLLTRHDVDDRARLFVVSTGLPETPVVQKRMRAQIIQQLIEEKLKTQEILKRHINVPPEQIAQAIANIEERNGMPHNALRNQLARDGISLTTLIDQLRMQTGWMVLLRQELGARSRVTPQQIVQRQQALSQEQGRPQYFMSEIFVPVKDVKHPEKELAFTKTIIQQLREGAPFPIVAAQFSQDQSALNGGSLGWVQEDHLDPKVVEIIRAMPNRAISNPIQVPGGFVIATVHDRRTVGKQMGTLLTLRQAFFPFTVPLNPQNPTDQQKLALQRATHASATLKDCASVEALNQSLGNKKPSDPGLQLEERLTPQMKAVLGPLPVGKATHPLVAPDGIALLMVCKREERNLAQLTPGQIADQLMNERIEQASRQLQRNLERRAVIEIRPEARMELEGG